MTEKIKRPRGLAKQEMSVVLSVIVNAGTITIEDLTNQLLNEVRTKYIYKYVYDLRKLGYQIKSNRDGRKVVSYTYNGYNSPTLQVVPKEIDLSNIATTNEIMEEIELSQAV